MCARSCYKIGWPTPMGNWKLNDPLLTKGSKTDDPFPLCSDPPSPLPYFLTSTKRKWASVRGLGNGRRRRESKREQDMGSVETLVNHACHWECCCLLSSPLVPDFICIKVEFFCTGCDTANLNHSTTLPPYLGDYILLTAKTHEGFFEFFSAPGMSICVFYFILFFV